MKTRLLSIMLRNVWYKVYVNLCDFRVGSYVILVTRDAHFYNYMSLGRSMPNNFLFDLLVHQNKTFKKII